MNIAISIAFCNTFLYAGDSTTVLQYFNEVRKMENFPKYYTLLFNAVTNAIADLDQRNYGAARSRLVKAQQDAEEAYLAAGDGEETSAG